MLVLLVEGLPEALHILALLFLYFWRSQFGAWTQARLLVCNLNGCVIRTSVIQIPTVFISGQTLVKQKSLKIFTPVFTEQFLWFLTTV